MTTRILAAALSATLSLIGLPTGSFAQSISSADPLKVAKPGLSLFSAIADGGHSKLPQPATQPATQPASQSRTLVAESVWRRFSWPEGRFSILFPGTPQRLQQSIEYVAGQTTQVQMFMVQRPQQAIMYLVAYNDYPFDMSQIPPNKIGTVLNAAQNGVLRSLKATFVSQTSLQLKGNPGREIRFKAPGNYVGRIRIFLVGERLYQVWTLVESSKQRSLTKSIEGFLSSFQLLPN